VDGEDLPGGRKPGGLLHAVPKLAIFVQPGCRVGLQDWGPYARYVRAHLAQQFGVPVLAA